MLDVLIDLAAVLFGSFCAACNQVAGVVIRFGVSIAKYCVAPDFDKCSLSIINVHC